MYSLFISIRNIDIYICLGVKKLSDMVSSQIYSSEAQPKLRKNINLFGIYFKRKYILVPIFFKEPSQHNNLFFFKFLIPSI